MSRKPTDTMWSELIKTFLVNEPKMSDRAVAVKLEETARSLNRDDAPSARTVNRLRKQLNAAPAEIREGYRFVHWPDSMTNGDLPWESSPVIFELLRYLRGMEKPFECPLRLALWFWRVTVSAPEADFLVRFQLALQLATWDADGWRTGPERYDPEIYLTYEPWRPENKKAYDRAVKAAGRPPNSPFVAEIKGGVEALPIVYVDRWSPVGFVYDLTHGVPYIAQATVGKPRGRGGRTVHPPSPAEGNSG